MPIYEYTCPKHGVFEKMLSIREKTDEAPCPKCKKVFPQHVSKPSSAVFVGRGFHCNDYRAPTKQ